ncbi:MAG: helix-hairpin-helix domain-containing protein [Clostridia bacterium]
MKNLKKVIILGIIIVIIIIYCIYNYIQGNKYEEVIQEDVYISVEENKIQEEKNIIILHITGAVKNPGIVQIEEGARLIDAIEAAGGTTENADTSKINLAYILSDGQKIYIPSFLDEKIENYVEDNVGENIIIENTNSNMNLVNINTATQTELETLTGIGPSLALKIINYRKENGKFKTIEDIKNVSGIGDSKFEAIKNEICV